jgi:putative ABC transport system permease protein
MKLRDILATASANMFRSKLRTLLTIIAIFIGAFTLTLTNGIGAGISAYIDKELGSLGAEDVLLVMGQGESTGLPTDEVKKYDPSKKTTALESQGNRTVTVLTNQDITKIRAIDGIKSAEPYQSTSIDYVTMAGKDKFIASTDTYLDGANYALDAGKLINNEAKERQALLPATYLKPLGFSSVEAAVGKTVIFGVTAPNGKLTEVSGTIIGVKQKTLAGGPTFSINTALLTELRRVQFAGLPAAATSSFQYATARFDPNLTDTQITALKDRITKAGYSATTIQDQIGAFKSVVAGIIAVLNGFAAIALLAASFGIINTLLMSVQERTKEIGLMKAVGMGSGRVFLLFSLEAMMLGFWGSLLGVLAAIGVGSIVNKVVMESFLKDLVGLQLLAFPPMSLVITVLIVMAIAFLAGTLPAIRAARKNPIDALRYE